MRRMVDRRQVNLVPVEIQLITYIIINNNRSIFFQRRSSMDALIFLQWVYGVNTTQLQAGTHISIMSVIRNVLRCELGDVAREMEHCIKFIVQKGNKQHVVKTCLLRIRLGRAHSIPLKTVVLLFLKLFDYAFYLRRSRAVMD